jgi:hypothetical protein
VKGLGLVADSDVELQGPEWCSPGLDRRGQLFDEFARVSDVAGSTPEAVDLSERTSCEGWVAAERKRLAERP